MVMRYWGAIGIYAETFADLVDPAAGGIRGEQLLRTLEARGWNARSLRGDAALVRLHLDAKQPVIALIEDRPGRFHYVVIVGWANGRVILHDPARAPFRLVDEQSFVGAWTASGFWTLIATPSDATAPAAETPAGAPANDVSASACDAVVSEGVRLAGSGDVDGARQVLELATGTCPQSAAAWREMAGLHALGGEWHAAAANARRALARDPGDQHAWRILATSLYLEEHPEGALAAWNRVGEPRIDLVDVQGLERTRYNVVARAIALEPQTVLTPDALQLARRRIADLPAALTTRVSYRPKADGRADITAVLLERPLFPTSPVSLVAAALRAAVDRELAAGVANVSGAGELWTASWRWWTHRPRLALAFTTPAPFGGTWGVDAFDERQTYSTPGSIIEESRRGAHVHVSDWTRSGLRWQGGAGLDRWRGRERSLSVGVSAHQRLAGDRAFVEVQTSAHAGDVRTWSAALRSEWRSASGTEGDIWIARVGLDTAGDGAPLALWPGAGTGQGRDVLLRAHSLLDDGIISDGVFGRQLAHGGAEWRRWFQRQVVRVAPAVFVDTARASRGLDGFDSRVHVDGGAGLRFSVSGVGVLRVDVARGLRDGAMAVSVGWIR